MAKKTRIERKPSIGGQAVLEGVMMKSPGHMAIAVRKDDGEIDVHVQPVQSPAARHKWMGWPFIRGVVNFIMSFKMGMATINKSTEMLGLEEEAPSRFEKWLMDKLGDKTEKLVMGFAMVLAVVLSVGLFIVLPSLIATFLKAHIANAVLVNVLEGLARLGIFLIYILAISKMKDIHRVFQYHGAEHKTVHCYEHDKDLTVENVRVFSTLHPRCGTAFLLIIMVLSIFFFSIFGWNLNALTRIVSRLALLPLVAGVSYEVLRLFAFADNAPVRVLRAPGLWLQRLTTREPDDEMIEVAIAAFKAAQTGTPEGEGEIPETETEERVLL